MKPNDKKVKEVYNKIASGFYHTRQQPITPEIEKLAKEWKPGKILDLGCGIGSSLLPFAKSGFECYGIDISSRMLKFAKQYAKKHDVKYLLKKADMLRIPFKKKEFGYLISIASLHHLDNEKKRLKALSEINRVLKPGGKFFIAVWNKPELYGKDAYISWKHQGKQYDRYYHFFSKKELKNLLKKAGLKAKIYIDEKEKNICILSIT